MKKKWLLLIAIPILAFFTYKYWDQHREKGLDEVIGYEPEKVEQLVFNEGPKEYEWRTEDIEHMNVLKQFLSQYRVKKMKNREWDTDVSREKAFSVSIYSKEKPIIAYIFENRIMIAGESYYVVLNAPVEVEWMENYILENRE